ncbi:hypothetical protein BJX61DRAFT_151579 [Aspergillus egyptiacus]|nr:hypothetical protein BJX61DRAFT_151579 [Aspergillus egyptiacus]
MGECSVYYVTEHENGHTLAAYDFRAGKQLYDSLEHIGYWPSPYGAGRFHTYDFQTLRTSGKNLIFRLRHVRSCQVLESITILSILDGETGKEIYSTTHPDSWHCSFHIDPITDFIVFRWTPTGFFRPKGWGACVVMQKTIYEAGAVTLSPLSTDVVFLPSDTGRLEGFENLITEVSPFHSVGLSCQCRRRWIIRGHALNLSTSEDLRATASDMLQGLYWYQAPPPPVSQCLVFAEGRSITGLGLRRRTKLDFPIRSSPRFLHFADQGPAVVEVGRHVYVLSF